jgi:hypothetical protein
VRETARLLVAAWLGLRLRAMLLLPIGGLFAYANPESQENRQPGRRTVCSRFAGPLANWVAALVVAASFWARAAMSACSTAVDHLRLPAAQHGLDASFLACCTCCPPTRSTAGG